MNFSFIRMIRRNYQILFGLLFLPAMLSAQIRKEISFNVNKLSKDGTYSIQVPLQHDVATISLTDIITYNDVEVNEQSVPIQMRIVYERKKPVALISFLAYNMANGYKDFFKQATLLIEEQPILKGNTQHRPTGAANSVLASGKWYKLAVNKRGVVKMDYSFLQSLGINPSQINPNKIRVYGNGGTVLPEKVTNNIIDDLEQNAIFVSSTGSSFGVNDYILFYANGPVKWTLDPSDSLYEHTPNYYENNSYYFLNFDLGNGKRITNFDATGTATATINSFDDYAVMDVDSFNPSKIGKIWWGHKMQTAGSGSASSTFNINMGTLLGDANIRAHVGGILDANNNNINITINDASLMTIFLPKINTNMSIMEAFQSTTASIDGNMNVKLTLNTSASGIGYLDFLLINAKRKLTMAGSGGQLSFRNKATSTDLNAFKLQSATSNLKVWEVTHPLNPQRLTGTLNNGVYTVVRPADTAREFIAFDGSSYLAPSFVGEVANQNLHALPQADLIIVTHQDLLPAAEELATFHRTKDGMKVNVATVDKIYNEFSSGGQDIAGIRDFVKMFYDRATNENEMPKNVLLFGAASYDYKNRIPNNTNLVPVYETAMTVVKNDAFASDDFYALMDEGDNLTLTSLFDVGVGRIPAKNLEEAQQVVQKIKNYNENASFGAWKNTFTFTSDNYDGGSWGTSHTADADAVSTVIEHANPDFNQVKLYGDVLPIVSTPGGRKMVAQNKALNDQIFLGTFMVNYAGHGAPNRLAAENLVTMDDINSWKNINKLPVFVTATCDFGRFDEPEEQSGGVKMFLKSDGGSIATLTTTQAVYATPNKLLNTLYIEKQFTKNTDGSMNTLGTALIKAKNESTNQFGFSYINNQKFAMIGDPALTLALPVYEVKTDSLLSLISGAQVDTISALGRYILKGSVWNNAGNVVSDFNGKVYVTILDKPQSVQIVSDPMPPDINSYTSQSSVIFKGIATVENGYFSMDFILPKDINYNFGKGKISYYADNGVVDASGADTNRIVGGFSADAVNDNDAPIVNVYMDNSKFRDGGVTGPDPLLYVELSDENGINVSGSAPGHDLVAILDEDLDNPYVMNNFYQTEPNNFTKGYVRFPLADLSEGLHTIRVKAWDTYNNSGEGAITFMVKNKDEGVIGEVYNYPNPFNGFTTFVIQHNLSKQDLDITIRIFDNTGHLVRTLEKIVTATGNNTEIPWDGHGDNGYGLNSGLYFYKIQIKTKDGIFATAQQKMSLIR